MIYRVELLVRISEVCGQKQRNGDTTRCQYDTAKVVWPCKCQGSTDERLVDAFFCVVSNSQVGVHVDRSSSGSLVF